MYFAQQRVFYSIDAVLPTSKVNAKRFKFRLGSETSNVVFSVEFTRSIFVILDTKLICGLTNKPTRDMKRFGDYFKPHYH